MAAKIIFVLIAALLLEHSGALPCVCLAESHGAREACCSEAVPESSGDCCGDEPAEPVRPICGCDHATKVLALSTAAGGPWPGAAMGLVPDALPSGPWPPLVERGGSAFAPPPPLRLHALHRVRLI